MYKLECELALTKPSKEAEGKIKEILDQIKEKAGKRTFTFTLKTKGNVITLALESPAQTASETLIQFENKAKQELGKQLKIGIKEVIIKTYELTHELQSTQEVTIPLVDKISFKEKKVTLTYKNIPFDWVKQHYVEKSLKLIEDKIRMAEYEGKDEFRDIVWEGKKRENKYTGDPAIDLEKKNWIKRTASKGQFIYGPEFTALINIFKELYITHVYEPLKFNEMVFPKFEPWSIPKKSGHAKNVYPTAYFISVPKNASTEYWQEVMDLYAITGEVPTEKIQEKIICTGILSFAQCPPFWPFVANRTIDSHTLPFLVYDWSGPTYRNESGGTHGLDRVEELHRVETLFMGTKKQVVKTWKDLQEAFIHFYDSILDIEIKVAKVTPWWMAHAGVKTAQGSDEIGTFDIDAYLPYRGNREKEWLEIQNVSSNGNKYGESFRVRTKDSSFIWSGCAGSSFQRSICAFLAQKGLDPQDWPKAIRDPFKKRMKKIRALKFF